MPDVLGDILVDAELDEPIHTMPLFGPKHACSRECWCHPEAVNVPEVLSGEHDAFIYQHNVAQ